MTDNEGESRRRGRFGLWIVAGISVVGAALAAAGIWHLPARMYPDPGDAEARAALQSGLLTAAAALIAVAGALVALDETRQANAEIRRANEAADARERGANANTHVRELYTRAVDQLGSDIVTIRLGGIYALERIAVDSPADQRTVVEVLSAFARERSNDPDLRQESAENDSSRPPWRPAADIRAVVQVLGRLPQRVGVPRCDLRNANFTGPASLAQLDLANADLSGAWLDRADLSGARLGRTNLSGARLSAAKLRHAGMNGSNLSGAMLIGADLSGARLARSDLSGTQLAEMCGIIGGNLPARARLLGTHLHGANLAGARLHEVDLTRTRGLTQTQVNAAYGNSRTCLTESLVRPASWGPEDPPSEG